MPGTGKTGVSGPLSPRDHPDILVSAPFEDPSEMDLASALVTAAAGRVGDDVGVPVPDELAWLLLAIVPSGSHCPRSLYQGCGLPGTLTRSA